jgi:hypothetical protein
MVEMDRNGIGSMALGLPENHDFTLFSWPFIISIGCTPGFRQS